ncbi:hypothetical protein [Streptomyces sp. NBC_01373]|uniref:hypothetical protein n=1 Tax=Streptomyces sp. NBC_01373 TaxID=2903843 RepID=UPI002258714B|nr:hypothetical protein [Streptomyces sp. NBC_01373]MCX4698307.1 hypothetical protein [Streptomyces sp. NBC_01373]
MTTTPSRTPAAVRDPAGSQVGRVLLALSAALGPLLLAVTIGVLPYGTDDSTREIVTAIAEDEALVQLAQWAWVFGLVLLVPGTLAVGLLAMTRAPKLGLWGLVVLGTGWMAIATTPSMDQVVLGGLDEGVSRKALVDVTDGTFALAVNAIPSFYFVAAHVIGAILLGAALLRGRTVPVWAAWLLILSMPLNVVGFASGLLPVTVLSFLMMAVAFGAAGLVVARHGTGWARAR